MAGDIVQVARGSHGDYQIIAICPESPQEMFDMTVHAFNLAEEYRVPVFVMAEGFIGHMRERVVIPDESEIKLVNRKITQGGAPLKRRDFLDPDVAPMPVFGRGLQAHVTSSCHDEYGNRNLSDPDVMHRYITLPIQKILSKRDRIVEVEADYDGAKLVLVSYGVVSRASRQAVRMARAEGLKVGTLRLKTAWPFPDKEVRAAAEAAGAILVLENNMGQLFPYIKAESVHTARVEFLGPQVLGQIHDPNYILAKIREMMK
jgi:2-oxoglutarate ferredoxin oxidoreductase subunit alpha